MITIIELKETSLLMNAYKVLLLNMLTESPQTFDQLIRGLSSLEVPIPLHLMDVTREFIESLCVGSQKMFYKLDGKYYLNGSERKL